MNQMISYVLKLVAVLEKYIQSVVCDDKSNELVLVTRTQKDVPFLIDFLKNHTNFLFSSLVDVTAVDWLGRVGEINGGVRLLERFQLVYLLISHAYNLRIKVVSFLNESDVAWSISSIMSGAVWAEREIYDMFGIFFVNHPDLRRILTDYGFEGYPLRKDFPVTGYIDVRYDDTEKCLVYETLELSQELRSFDTQSPWVAT